MGQIYLYGPPLQGRGFGMNCVHFTIHKFKYWFTLCIQIPTIKTPPPTKTEFPKPLENHIETPEILDPTKPASPHRTPCDVLTEARRTFLPRYPAFTMLSISTATPMRDSKTP